MSEDYVRNDDYKNVVKFRIGGDIFRRGKGGRDLVRHGYVSSGSLLPPNC